MVDNNKKTDIEVDADATLACNLFIEWKLFRYIKCTFSFFRAKTKK